MAKGSIRAPSRAVPVFFLYGEPRRSVGPRFLHLEALELRSRLTGWAIRPHVHADLHHLFLISGGSGRMHADGGTMSLEAPCLLTVPARIVHGFAWERETHGAVLTLADGTLRDLLAREPEFSALFASPACLPGADAAAIGRQLASLGRELAWSAPAHAAAVEAHLLLILVEALRLQKQASGLATPRPGRALALVARFREAVEAGYRAGTSVEGHAAALGVTAPMLRRACAQAAGCPPIRIIHERLFLEAQRVLLYTNMNVGETATYLGFEDSAYFTRFFTSRAGRSPRRFRAAGDRMSSEMTGTAPGVHGR